MVTHDLPSSLQTDILQVVVAAFLVLLQRTALLVAPAAVVALVRLPHCGKNESTGSDPSPELTPPPQTTLVMETHLRKVARAPGVSPRPVFPPHTPPPTRQVLCPIRFSH